MKDQFLQNYRKPPRQAYLQVLRNHLEIYEQKAKKMTNIHLRPVFLGALTLIMALALVFTISPAARAQVQDWIGQVGGVLFTTTANYPGSGPVTTVDEDLIRLVEAREVLPFSINLPTWVPEGYVLRDEVRRPYFDDGLARAMFRWDSPQNAAFFLSIEQHPEQDENNWIVGPGSIEEVQVNGQPAALVRGAWDYNEKQWSHIGVVTIYWQHDGQTYSLQAHEDQVPIDDLIRIAESIP